MSELKKSARKSSLRARMVAATITCLLVCVGFVAQASAEIIDRIVAQVNDEIITLYELEEAVMPFLVQHGQNPRVLRDEARRAQLLEETLEDLVDRILVRHEAKRLGVEVSQGQVDRWMAETRQAQGMSEEQFRMAIRQSGIEFSDYRQIIEDNLLRMSVLQARARGGGVSEAEVESVYRRRFGQSATQRFVEVRHILIVPDPEQGGDEAARARVQELRERIENGEPFEDVARAESQGPGASDGGYLGTFRRGQLAQSFEDAVFQLPEGELAGPVRTDFGYHLIEVLSVEERVGADAERRKDEIRAMLQQREMERQMTSFLQTLRARAFVDVRL